MAGKFYVKASAKNRKPLVIDRNKAEVMDPAVIYPGAKYRAIITAYAYSNSGNNGVGFGLEILQKTQDGTPLGGAVADPNMMPDLAPLPGAPAMTPGMTAQGVPGVPGATMPGMPQTAPQGAPMAQPGAMPGMMPGQPGPGYNPAAMNQPVGMPGQPAGMPAQTPQMAPQGPGMVPGATMPGQPAQGGGGAVPGQPGGFVPAPGGGAVDLNKF